MNAIEIATRPGERITATIAHALAQADEHQRPVRFDFNGAQVVVSPGDDPQKAEAQWQSAMDANAEAYRASPEGVRAAKEAADRLLRHQADHDRLMEQLPAVARDEGRLVAWCAEFAEAADHVGVTGKDFPRVIGMLEAAGWKNNDMVGKGPAVRASPSSMARWIIGQAINCMASGIGPHPITGKFADDYRQMKAEQTP